MAEEKLLDKGGLDAVGKMAVKILIQEITKAKGSTRIVNQIDYRLQDTAKIIIEAPGYLTFIDQGRRPGKLPPIQAIANWAKLKGINPKYAWPIAVNIMKFGIKPTRVIQKTVRRIENELTEEIETRIATHVEETITNNINNGN
jgi:hypothetical protein